MLGPACGDDSEITAVTPTLTSHIEIDETGVSWITNTKTKVIEVVLDRVADGWSPEEIHFQHPYLSLAQIHAALAYYYDNKEKLDKEIERRREDAEGLARQLSNPRRRRELTRNKRRS
jgi:uncharacterized protein (DUF433 family)